LTAHMHKCNRICHYYIPSLETSLLMAMLRSKYVTNDGLFLNCAIAGLNADN